MKKLFFLSIVYLFVVSCDNNNQQKGSSVNVEPNTVNLFLKDIYSLLLDTNKNPIVSFSNLAVDFSSKTLALNKNNISSALDEAREYSHVVVVVENHTIVKLTNFEDCQKSGSWGVCMPKGEGFIKKGKLNYKSDYLNNIIGIPSSKKVTLFLFKDESTQKESEENQDDEYLNSVNNLKVHLKQLDDKEYVNYLISEYQTTENELENYAVYQLFDQGLLPIERVKIDDEESFTYYYFMNKSGKNILTDSTALYPPYCKTLVYIDDYQTIKKIEVIETDELSEWGRSKSYYCNKESLNFPIIYNYNFSDFYGYINAYLLFKGSGENISLLNASEEENGPEFEGDFISKIDITQSKSTIKEVFSLYIKIKNVQFIDQYNEPKNDNYQNELEDLSIKLKSDSKNKLNVAQVIEFNNAARGLSLPFYMKFTSDQPYPYNNIIYKRLTPIGDWDFFRLLHFDWFSNKPIDGKPITNQMYIDFVLYDNISDAKTDVNAWKFCNYNDPGVGFPRDCGKEKAVGGKWISYYPGLNSRTEKDFSWSLASNVAELDALVDQILNAEYSKEKYQLKELSKKLISDSKNKLDIYQVNEFNNAARELPLPFYMEFTSDQPYPYNKIIYKRLTPIGDWDFFRLLHFDWFSNKKIDGKFITNVMNNDFNLYDNISDAKAGVNAWKFCNYNDPGVGFPRDCGKERAVGGKWISFYPGLSARTKKAFSWHLVNQYSQMAHEEDGEMDGVEIKPDEYAMEEEEERCGL